MNLQSLITWVQAHPSGAIFLGIMLFFVLMGVAQKIGWHIWYFVVPLLALFGARAIGDLLYFYAFVLGMLTAFAEIISKFNDEPIKSLKTPHAVIYHTLNGLIAAFALYVLYIFGVASNTPADQLKLVLAAGLGSMLVMRSKLFNIKSGEEDISFGPEQIIKIYFRFMEAAIDRVRARSRISFIKTKMGNIHFEKVYEHSLTMLRAPQAWDPKAKTLCQAEIMKLKEEVADVQLKSYQLGFVLMNAMGEDFVSELFDNASDDWKIDPSKEKDGKKKNLFSVEESNPLSALPFIGTKNQSYFAYGSNMSEQKLLTRLGWEVEETQFPALTKPQKCVLENYRLAFNKPDREGPNAEGMPNIVETPGGKVEGILYQLPKDAMEIIDYSEVGYKRKPDVEVKVGNKKMKAHVYVAESTSEGLKPNTESLSLVLDAARTQQLDPEYIKELEAWKNEPVSRRV
ncbi:MAG TPA: gamma-glutamylcyclotransferase family protein [Pyrinomonadaceae bacterium]|jgi:hypothetical protein